MCHQLASPWGLSPSLAISLAGACEDSIRVLLGLKTVEPCFWPNFVFGTGSARTLVSLRCGRAFEETMSSLTLSSSSSPSSFKGFWKNPRKSLKTQLAGGVNPLNIFENEPWRALDTQSISGMQQSATGFSLI
jgi:hypothetical protein